MPSKIYIRRILKPIAAGRTPLRIRRTLERYELDPSIGVRRCLRILEDRQPSHDNRFEYSDKIKDEIRKRTINVVDHYSKIRNGKWYSYIHKNIVTPQKIQHPKNLADLKKLVADATEKTITVKAVGSGHSFSDIFSTRGWLIDTHSMSGELPLKSGWLKKHPLGFNDKIIDNLNSLIRIKAGTTIEDLNNILEKKGQALYNMGGYDGQTFMGAASTSTHGTGITLPPFCDMILSLVLVTEKGKAYRIEPKNGITDSAKYPVSEPELIQDNDTFYSVIVSVGCMGVIYSVIIQTRKAYVLQEKRRVKYWHDLKKRLTQNRFRGDEITTNRHYNVLINPYISRSILGLLHKDKRVCLVNTINEVDETVPDDRPARTADSSLERLIARELKFMDPEELARTINVTFDLLALGNLFNYTNKSYKTFIAGGVGIGGYAAEWSFPLNKSLMALEAIFKTLDKAAKDGEQVETGPISLRYVKRSKAYLSPQYGRDTCMIELLSLYGTPGRPADYVLMHRFYDALIQLDGRPTGAWNSTISPMKVDSSAPCTRNGKTG